VDAARAAGVSRFVHMSAIGVSPDSRAEYARTKWDGEQIVRRSGLDWTVFRPGVIQGPAGELVAQVREMASGDVAPFFFLPFFARFEDHEEGVLLPRLTLEPAKLAPVSVVDVATAFAEALARPQTVGEVYNLSGPEVLNWRQFMEFMRDTLPGTDKGITVLPVPSTHAAVIATGAKYLGLAGLLPFDAGQAHMAGQDSDADLDKVRAHLGLEPRGFREDVRRWAGQMPARA
jgi:NADH dehydrogenase